MTLLFFAAYKCAASRPVSVTLQCDSANIRKVILSLHIIAVETSPCSAWGPCFSSDISTTDYECLGKSSCTFILKGEYGSCKGHAAQIEYQCLPGITMYDMYCFKRESERNK